MRHTITCTVVVESDCQDPAKIADAVLSHLTDMQDQEFNSADVLPGGAEVNKWSATLSVVSAESDGMKSTAGWAA